MMKPVRIADLADALHPRRSVRKALALLIAYFDESGTHERSPITAIGGFVATKDAWAEFETDLAAVLAPYADKGVRDFHFHDCLVQEGEFARVSKPHINAIFWGVGRALRKAKATTIFAAVVQDDWDAVAMPEAFKARFPTPYALCFEEVLEQLARWSLNYGDGEPVVPIFAVQDEYLPHATAVALGMDQSNKHRGQLSGISFNRPRRLLPP